MSVEQILTNALGIISDPKAWHQGSGQNAEGTAFCSIGAIVQSGVHSNLAIGTLQLVIDESTDSPISLVAWNDHPDRTHAEVVEMFEKAIARAGEMGI